MSVTPITALYAGDAATADWLDSLSEHWTVTHVADTITGFWDAIENNSMPFTGVTLFSENSGTAPDDLEATLASLASTGVVVVVAGDEMDAMNKVARAREVAATLDGCDPGAVVHAVGMRETDIAMKTLTAVFGEGYGFAAAYPAPLTAPTAPTSAPQGRPVAPARPVGVNSGVAKPTGAGSGQITIACMSSKGGCGKSTVALSLAGTIARASAAAGDPKSVVVVDLDTRDGQVGLFLGQYKPTALNLRVEPQWDQETVLRTLVHDESLGIDALLAPMRPRNADDVGPDFYSSVIDVLQTTHDVVIFDCSVAYMDPLLNVAFAKADEILFVTSLANTSVQGMARALKEMFTPQDKGGLGIAPHKVGVVANAVTNDAGLGKDQLLRAASGAPLVGAIPMDSTAVLQATNTTRMADLLKHEHIGPAFHKLAEKCVPGFELKPVTAGAVTAKESTKKGIFKR